ncbi:MAG: archaeosine biosynthesis radical SAM protein RaSEA [Candidatus Thermoplasmatota archaeon]|jgi:hypothetical protein|nr:archaeosine biosynthesis radical SAM protein RaSEA [Candidatus Thermoplasmatota archaeon]
MINRQLSESIKNLMPARARTTNPDKPVSMWRERDRLRGFPENTMVVIFRTAGCAWYNFSSCSMCGYFNDVASNITLENLKNQIDSVAGSLGDVRVLKVFTSGSFLDPLEFHPEARDYFFRSIQGKIDKLLVESRTEYITESNIGSLRDYGIPVRIAIGLESSNDQIIRNSINKGSSFSKFVSASSTARRLGYELRTYLLFKPLFMSEKAAIADMIQSIEDARTHSTDISVNPMNIQKHTLVESMWKKGLYRLPRLWSLARILLETSDLGAGVVSYPTGGNRERGIHNEENDPELLNLIYEASLTQDFSGLREYYDSVDRGAYEEFIDAEDINYDQPDYPRLLARIMSSSTRI